ncbi:MAG: WecB/TagA/CpsF family glycosyltransferase [Paracoccaceae bacterium]
MIDWSHLQSRGSGLCGPIHVNMDNRMAFLEDIEAHLQARKGFAVATLNLDHVVKIRRDPAFCAAYAAHSHITADGNPIVWFSKLAGHEVDLMPGSEMISPVVSLAAQHDVPVALLGATEASLDQAATALMQAYPGLRIVARIAPPMGFEPTGHDADRCIEELRQSGTRLCFLALGAPKQERFAVHAARALPETGFMSIGAGLDFISGAQTRAPMVVQKLALEWLWRLSQNPQRLAARYGACIAILPRLLISAVQSRQIGPERRGAG